MPFFLHQRPIQIIQFRRPSTAPHSFHKYTTSIKRHTVARLKVDCISDSEPIGTQCNSERTQMKQSSVPTL